MKPLPLWMFSLKKTIPYPDIPKISRMMKEYSSRAVFDKMDVFLVKKKLIFSHRFSSFEIARQRLFVNLLKWGRA
jgi:hypothetical protein